jgi:glycosyltransferase involved in cell wall biosynthesis
MVVHHQYPVDTRVARAVRVALESGFEVDVIALRRPGEATVEAVEGATVYRLPLTHRFGAGLSRIAFEYVGFAGLATIRVAALMLRKRYRVVHVNNPPDFLIIAALFPKLLGARVIFDVHDLSSDMFSMRFEGRAGGRTIDRALRFLERAAARAADQVITVHEPYRQELIRRGVSAGKTDVIMNSVDEALLARAERRPPDDTFRVVYHGTLTPHYGVHLLVEAIAEVVHEIPNVRLELYGEGDSVPDLQARIRELGLVDRAHVNRGMLPQAEVIGLVSSANVGVIPNIASQLNHFALSSKLFEYVLLGIPVISADLPTIRAHFGDDEVLFFRNGDAHALARAIVMTADDPDGAAKRVEAARRRYEQYRWPLYAQRYAQIIHG